MQTVKQMKAVQILEARRINYGAVDVPQYGPDEVLIKVHRVGVCATDLEIYQGIMVYFLNGQSSFPIIPGHEWAGEIVAKGIEVQDFEIGDRVVGETTISCGRCPFCLHGQYNLCPRRIENGVLAKDGACAEYMVYPAHALHKFDPALGYDEACLIEPSAVAYRGVQKLSITPRDRVAVLGAGPIGLLSAQIAKAFGARQVVMVDMRDNRLQKGLQLGCDGIIDLSREDLTKAASRLTDGEMFSAIIEATGNTAAVENVTSIAALGARVALLGLCGGKRAQMDVDHIVTHDLEIYGSLSSPGVWASVVHMLESGKLKTKDLITHRFPVRDLEKAFHLMENKDPSIIKIILEIGQENE